MHCIIKSNLLQLNCIFVFEGAFEVGFMWWGFFGVGFVGVWVGFFGCFCGCVCWVFVFSPLKEDPFPSLQRMRFPSVSVVFLLRSAKAGVSKLRAALP